MNLKTFPKFDFMFCATHHIHYLGHCPMCARAKVIVDYALVECKCCGTIYHVPGGAIHCPLCFGDELVGTTVRTMIDGALLLTQRQRDLAFESLTKIIEDNVHAGATVVLVAKTRKEWMVK